MVVRNLPPILSSCDAHSSKCIVLYRLLCKLSAATNSQQLLSAAVSIRSFYHQPRNYEHLHHASNRMREWYNGSIVAFQAIDPGSTPGSRTLFLNCGRLKRLLVCRRNNNI